MGIIQRQGIKYSIVNYFGVIIGAISTIFIYPHDTELYGLIRFLLDTANLFMPLALLGTAALSIKFYPYFQAHERNGFFFFLNFVAGVGCVLFLSLAFFFKNPILAYYSSKSSPLYLNFVSYIAIFVIIYVFSTLYRQYAANAKRIVVPSVLDQSLKIVLPIIFLAYLWEKIDITLTIQYLSIYLTFTALVSLGYLWWLGLVDFRPNFRLFSLKIRREMRNFALSAIIGTAGSVIALRIDSFMVSSMIDLDSNGIYGIASLIAMNIAIPLTAINNISGPIIARAWAHQDMAEIEMIYQKSSLNLLIIGLLLFIGICVCIDDLFQLMPNSEKMLAGKNVVLLLGLAKLFDMATGANDPIIGFSKYFYFGLYAILVLAGFTIFFNYLLIPSYQLEGVAIATMISSILYNFLKYIFIKNRFHITPFTSKTAQVLLIGGVVGILAYMIPSSAKPLFNLGYKASVITLFYLGFIFYFKISEDLNGLLASALSRFNLKK